MIIGVDDIGGGSVILVELQQVTAAVLHDLMGVQIGINVGPAKAIDRLLGVADQIEDIRAVALVKNALPILPLKLIGVLKLVDKRVLVALSKRLHQGITARALQALPHQAEHIVEDKLTALVLKLAQHPLQNGRKLGRDGRLKRRQRLIDLPHALPHLAAKLKERELLLHIIKLPLRARVAHHVDEITALAVALHAGEQDIDALDHGVNRAAVNLLFLEFGLELRLDLIALKRLKRIDGLAQTGLVELRSNLTARPDT